jgi:hypothetical protein
MIEWGLIFKEEDLIILFMKILLIAERGQVLFKCLTLAAVSINTK